MNHLTYTMYRIANIKNKLYIFNAIVYNNSINTNAFSENHTRFACPMSQNPASS